MKLIINTNEFNGLDEVKEIDFPFDPNRVAISTGEIKRFSKEIFLVDYIKEQLAPKRTYVLLKDTPTIKAGAKFIYYHSASMNHSYYKQEEGLGCTGNVFEIQAVEGSPEWFGLLEGQIPSASASASVGT